MRLRSTLIDESSFPTCPIVRESFLGSYDIESSGSGSINTVLDRIREDTNSLLREGEAKVIRNLLMDNLWKMNPDIESNLQKLPIEQRYQIACEGAEIGQVIFASTIPSYNLGTGEFIQEVLRRSIAKSPYTTIAVLGSLKLDVSMTCGFADYAIRKSVIMMTAIQAKNADRHISFMLHTLGLNSQKDYLNLIETCVEIDPKGLMNAMKFAKTENKKHIFSQEFLGLDGVWEGALLVAKTGTGLFSEYLEYFDFYLDPKDPKQTKHITADYKKRLRELFIMDVSSTVSIEGVNAFSHIGKYPFGYKSLSLPSLAPFYSQTIAREEIENYITKFAGQCHDSWVPNRHLGVKTTETAPFSKEMYLIAFSEQNLNLATRAGIIARLLFEDQEGLPISLRTGVLKKESEYTAKEQRENQLRDYFFSLVGIPPEVIMSHDYDPKTISSLYTVCTSIYTRTGRLFFESLAISRFALLPDKMEGFINFLRDIDFALSILGIKNENDTRRFLSFLCKYATLRNQYKQDEKRKQEKKKDDSDDPKQEERFIGQYADTLALYLMSYVNDSVPDSVPEKLSTLSENLSNFQSLPMIVTLAISDMKGVHFDDILTKTRIPKPIRLKISRGIRKYFLDNKVMLNGAVLLNK